MVRCEMILPPKLFFVRASLLLFLVLHNVTSQNYEGRRLKPCELESLLRDLTYPEEGYEMHAVALRNQLRHILEHDPSDRENYQNLEDSSEATRGPYEDKRSYRALLRDGAVFGKRNVGALARAGLLRNQPEYLKRSLATLAKNGQLPSRDTESEDTTPDGEWNEDKRNVASALQSGYMLNGKRNIASLARKYELPGKRNIQSLLRTGMLPSIAPKRNIQSLARENVLTGYGSIYKRNIQTLVRDWSLPKQHNKLSESSGSTSDNEKRNIQSLKNAQGRKKRSLYYDEMEESSPEVLEPVFQTAPLDYEELMDAMVQTYPLHNTDNHLEEKRFLARPRSRANITPDPSHYDNQPAAYVDNAYMDSEVPLVGELQGYSPRGVPRRLELPRYTGEAFASHPYVHDEFSERVNPFYTDDEYRCANRLRKLLYYLKKQYYLDNKYIQATYGRNLGYYQ
ncbi:neuropeptide-like 1 isoform X3 [Anopheles gambiae]|uniref:Neuropeptide-like 1 n=1 Tax=Anopheles coluzzii TaxID=1518534 RepID=A0A6E8W2C0_ANOCL|nr:neuropeptide-like 1 isoform X2 [Anopheles coluzzii]XP_061517687.1 neuropeptide-like 1 isoform X3 [Anopheles gambiae]